MTKILPSELAKLAAAEGKSHAEAMKIIKKENPDWPEGDLLGTIGSVSPSMGADARKVQKRYQELTKRASTESTMFLPSELARLGKFPAGVSMTIDEVAAVVGPEFKEMNENPPPEVVALRDGMTGKTAANMNHRDAYALSRAIRQEIGDAIEAGNLQSTLKGIWVAGHDQADVDLIIKAAMKFGWINTSVRRLSWQIDLSGPIPGVELGFDNVTDGKRATETKHTETNKFKTAVFEGTAKSKALEKAEDLVGDLNIQMHQVAKDYKGTESEREAKALVQKIEDLEGKIQDIDPDGMVAPHKFKFKTAVFEGTAKSKALEKAEDLVGDLNIQMHQVAKDYKGSEDLSEVKRLAQIIEDLERDIGRLTPFQPMFASVKFKVGDKIRFDTFGSDKSEGGKVLEVDKDGQITKFEDKGGTIMTPKDVVSLRKKARFEEGQPADPTAEMSAEDKAAWEANTEKYKGKFTGEEAMMDKTFDVQVLPSERFSLQATRQRSTWPKKAEDDIAGGIGATMKGPVDQNKDEKFMTGQFTQIENSELSTKVAKGQKIQGTLEWLE